MSFSSNIQSIAARLRGFTEASAAKESALSLSADDLASATADEFGFTALELFRFQFEHNRAYRKICEARQATPQTVECWSRIPAVPTAAFKEFDLSCLSAEERTTVFFSSGTTETRPSRHFHNGESLSLYEASVVTGFRWAGVAGAISKGGPGQSGNLTGSWPLRLLSLTPDKTASPHSSLVHMFETLGGSSNFRGSEFFGTTGSDGSWQINLTGLQDRIEKAVVDGEPLMMAGTAFSFVHLLDFLAARKMAFALPPGSCVLETGGYKGRSRSLPKAELHLLISAGLGVQPTNIICEYGMAELSSQAYDCRPIVRGPRIGRENSSRRFSFPPWARAQVISPESRREVSEGELGLIRVFDLGNAFSVLAVQTEDLAIRRGAGFEMIGRSKQAEPRGCSLMATT